MSSNTFTLFFIKIIVIADCGREESMVAFTRKNTVAEIKFCKSLFYKNHLFGKRVILNKLWQMEKGSNNVLFALFFNYFYA